MACASVKLTAALSPGLARLILIIIDYWTQVLAPKLSVSLKNGL